MEPRWELQQAVPKGKIVRKIFPPVSNAHHLKELSLCTQDVVGKTPQQYTLPDLGPRIQVSETKALSELPEVFHPPEIHQHISNFMTARVLGLFNVGVEIPYNYGILVP